MMNKKILIFLSIIFIFFNIVTVIAQNTQKYGETDVHFKLKKTFLDLILQTYELFQNQLFWVEVTVKTNQTFDANTFNVTLEIPSNFALVNDVYDHSNLPINESTGYQWTTSWVVNSSISLPNVYTINASENLFFNKKSETIIINSGPTFPYNISVITNKASYSFGETGNVFTYIFDSNGHPFNVEGTCNSTIYYPDKTSTSFKNVLMSYVVGSNDQYISSSSFQAWNIEGTYKVEVNCTKPDVYASNSFTIYSGITTTTVIVNPTQPPEGGGGGGGGGQVKPPVNVLNFSIDVDLIKVLLTPNKTEKKSIKIFNNGNNKLDIKGKIQNLEQLTFFKDGGVEYKFELNPNETKEIEINFLSKKDMEAGVYPGKVVFTSNGIERTVSFIVEVESEKPLFDVKVEILSEYKKVYPSDKVVAQLTIYNLGKIGKVVVNVEYGIKDLSGKIIATENENLTVETQLSVLKALNTSSTLKPDNYVFFGKVNYKNIVGTGSDMFQLLEKPKFALSFNYFLLIFLILLIILAVYILKKVNKRKKK